MLIAFYSHVVCTEETFLLNRLTETTVNYSKQWNSSDLRAGANKSLSKSDLTFFSLFQTNFTLLSPQTVSLVVLALPVASCVEELLQMDERKKWGNRKKEERGIQERTERTEERGRERERDKGSGIE